MTTGHTPKTLAELISELEKLPSIGKKTAERLAYYILKTPKSEAVKLADAIVAVKDKARHCRQCFTITEEELCSICSDDRRDRSAICVVEKPGDIDRVEDSGVFRGLYHVLMGQVSPLDGVQPDDLTIPALVKRVKSPEVKEVIIATNPTVEGEATAMAISRALTGEKLRITRIARGVPSGTSLEYTNKSILTDALRGRSEFRLEDDSGGGRRP